MATCCQSIVRQTPGILFLTTHIQTYTYVYVQAVQHNYIIHKQSKCKKKATKTNAYELQTDRPTHRETKKMTNQRRKSQKQSAQKIAIKLWKIKTAARSLLYVFILQQQTYFVVVVTALLLADWGIWQAVCGEF